MQYLIIPEFSRIKETLEITEKYNVKWEYNDFYNPDVYNNPDEITRRINTYKSLGRNTSNDTMHGTFLGLDLAAVDPVIRNRSRQLYCQSLEIAEKLGVKGVVFHTGLVAGLRVDYYINNWIEQSVEFWSKQCEKYPNLTIYIENSFEQEPDVFVRLMEQMHGTNNFKLCLDYGHAIITQTDVEVWCSKFAPYIGHMHLNDNDLIDDLHLIPGAGKIDFCKWKELMRENSIDVPVLLEIKGLEKVEKALNYMEDIVNETTGK